MGPGESPCSIHTAALCRTERTKAGLLAQPQRVTLSSSHGGGDVETEGARAGGKEGGRRHR